MDFWSRLTGGGAGSNHKRNAYYSNAQSPQQRLQRFRRAYNPILQILSRYQPLSAARTSALDQIYVCLQRIAALLREESRTPAPHLCLSFAVTSQIHSVIARAAATSQDARIVREATAVFGILIDSEGDDFLGSSVFARSLTRFVVRILDTGGFGNEVEAEIIEVLFGVAAKIRVQPEILAVWFTSSSIAAEDNATAREKNSFAGATQKDDFPICYIFIDRIHHDGRTGDFARTGLLYIFEAVSHSPALEEWIMASDLPTLMASGLGALYSQLSRELSIMHEEKSLPLLLAMSDYADSSSPSTAESIFSATHANHMVTFLSHLAFWQDVLEHCKSPDVKQTLLDHFRVLFLQQLLYPSLLQSSDTDGGSSVAVLTYISNILESLEHPDLVRLILQYLLAIPDEAHPDPSPPRSPTFERRRSSLMILAASHKDEDELEPTVFSLVDLVLNGIRSQNPQTVVAALKLSSVMLNRHRDYATSTLIKVEPRTKDGEKRTVGALAAEIEQLMDLAVGMGGRENMDIEYRNALQDVVSPLEHQLLKRTNQTLFVDSTSPHPNLDMRTLPPTDSFLQAIVPLFRTFLANRVDVNLALTETVLQLALCSHIKLDNWFAAAPTAYQFASDEDMPEAPTNDSMDDEERDEVRRLWAMHRKPQHEMSQSPLLPALLHGLQLQINSLGTIITNIDKLITKRMDILGEIHKEESIERLVSAATPNGKPPSDLIVESLRTLRPGESAQVQRLRAESVATSRTASPDRSPTPSRARRDAESPARSRAATMHLPPRSSSLPEALPETPGRLSQSVFQPPPPDSPSEDTTDGDPIKNSIKKESEAETLQRRIRFRQQGEQKPEYVLEVTGKAVTKDDGDAPGALLEVTLSHVLTNVVILHHFILEMTAVMQTRAALFEEVAFV